MLYKLNNILTDEKIKERDLGQHLGMQEINDKSKERKSLIEESFQNGLDANYDAKEIHLFNTHYSNIVYTCNFMIRVFPYVLPAIELQGEGFDNPNRLFYSVKKAMENTLTQKSDLRELIPEIYYFPDLFMNKNEFKFGLLLNGNNIDNIDINEEKEDKYKKYEFLAQLKNYLEFDKLKLNSWINLIFGKNQKTIDNKEYYGNEMYIHLKKDDQEKDVKDPLNMQRYDFGIQPYQLFNNNFPDLEDKSQYFIKIKQYNIEQFSNEHKIIKGNKNKCFYCEGYNNKNEKYICEIKQQLKKNTYFHYITIFFNN